MHRLLLMAAAAAATLTFASPIGAQSFASGGARSGGGSWGSHGFPVAVSSPNAGGVHIHRGHGGGFASGYYSSGYNDYGDYDANRSFDPEKWNDWWHDRPDRAFPRWMSRNQDCARRWYSGDVLTC